MRPRVPLINVADVASQGVPLHTKRYCSVGVTTDDRCVQCRRYGVALLQRVLLLIQRVYFVSHTRTFESPPSLIERHQDSGKDRLKLSATDVVLHTGVIAG